MSKYSYRNGCKVFKGVSADVAGQELERIRKEEGKLLPQTVVELAEAEDHPLHPAFTWDDSEAARAHRLWEARLLIRQVVIKIVNSKESEPAFIHVRISPDEEATENYYQSSSVIISKPDEMEAALEESRARLTAAEQSFRQTAKVARRVSQPKPKIKKLERVVAVLSKTQRQAASL